LGFLRAAMSLPTLEQGNYSFQAPNVVGNTRFHRRSNAQRLMNPAEIVMHVMKRYSVLQVPKLLAECIGQLRKTAH